MDVDEQKHQRSMQQVQGYIDGYQHNVEEMRKLMMKQATCEFNFAVREMLMAFIELFPRTQHAFSMRFSEALNHLTPMLVVDASIPVVVESFVENVMNTEMRELIEKEDASVFWEACKVHGGMIAELFQEANFETLWPIIPPEGKEMIWAYLKGLIALANNYLLPQSQTFDRVMERGWKLRQEYEALCNENGEEPTLEGLAQYMEQNQQQQ